MPPQRGHSGIPFSGRLIFGAVLLTLGTLWTADNLGVLDADQILRWWPVFLMAFGITRLLGILGPRSVVSGTIFTAIGFWMLLRELDIVHVSLFRLWPMFLILLGASLVFRSMRPSGTGDTTDRASYPRPFAFMGGVVRNIESEDLAGIEATAVMGGVELDLRGARSRAREIVVESFAWWGGIELYVPEDWQVVNEVTPIMGGVEDRTRWNGEGNTKLIVRGMVVMAGIEIRNEKGSGEFKGIRVGVTRGQRRREEMRTGEGGAGFTSDDRTSVPPPAHG
jgi:hypothetical protein